MTAQQLVGRMITAEGSLGPVGDRVIRDERMKLQSAAARPTWRYVEDGQDKKTQVQKQLTEALRVAQMYGVEVR